MTHKGRWREKREGVFWACGEGGRGGGQPDINELMNLSCKSGDRPTLTIDSGASENIMSERLAPQCPARPSVGSQEGIK